MGSQAENKLFKFKRIQELQALYLVMYRYVQGPGKLMWKHREGK